MKNLTNQQLAYVFARVAFGLNFFIHGLVRMPKMSGFANGVIGKFEDTMLPVWMVTPMAWLIPPAELILGLALILGLWTRLSLIGTASVMLLLLTGSCFMENWGIVGSQMVYVLYIYFLIAHLEHNRLAVTK
ncbi:MAG: DoxX family membrane protein [Akkermansiaceae bacterium]